MKASELIKELEYYIQTYGDKEVSDMESFVFNQVEYCVTDELIRLVY